METRELHDVGSQWRDLGHERQRVEKILFSVGPEEIVRLLVDRVVEVGAGERLHARRGVALGDGRLRRGFQGQEVDVLVGEVTRLVQHVTRAAVVADELADRLEVHGLCVELHELAGAVDQCVVESTAADLLDLQRELNALAAQFPSGHGLGEELRRVGLQEGMVQSEQAVFTHAQASARAGCGTGDGGLKRGAGGLHLAREVTAGKTEAATLGIVDEGIAVDRLETRVHGGSGRARPCCVEVHGEVDRRVHDQPFARPVVAHRGEMDLDIALVAQHADLAQPGSPGWVGSLDGVESGIGTVDLG